MFNPLLGNISKLTDQDLEAKLLDLNKKYHIAMRLGQGGIADQILTNLEAYRSEQQQRHHDANKEITRKNHDQGLDDLINVD
jgi:hypothetical protein